MEYVFQVSQPPTLTHQSTLDNFSGLLLLQIKWFLVSLTTIASVTTIPCHSWDGRTERESLNMLLQQTLQYIPNGSH